MTGDGKTHDGSTSKAETLRSQASASVSKLDRKLSVELPLPRQIYTIGSTVSGLVHLGTKDRSAIQEVQVSLVCVVHTRYHRYYGGSTHDVRLETTKLLHLDQTLWSRAVGDASDLPSDFAFHITIPEFGNDAKARNPRAPLPPSFHAGKQTGWMNPTYGSSIGYIRYHIKVSVARKGHFKRKERALCPFVFLPQSPPPPLLPTLPDVISLPDLDRLNDGNWIRDIEITTLRTGVFSSRGFGQITLWIPQVPSFPRLLPIPFVLCLALQTRRVKNVSGTEPPKDILPPAAQLNKASLHLTQSIQTNTRGATQDQTKVIDKNATDNFLHGTTPQEGAWIMKKAHEESYWEKVYIWRGSWTFNEVPNFATRQITWKYALVAEAPIKGLGNGVKVVSRTLEMSSGVTAGANVTPTSEADMLELPPGYFDTEGWNEDEDYDRDDKKA